MMTKVTLNVSGMTCGGCEESVRKAVTRLDGVAEVLADHQAGTVLVTADGIERGAIVQAIEDAGYDVLSDDIKQLPMA